MLLLDWKPVDQFKKQADEISSRKIKMRIKILKNSTASKSRLVCFGMSNQKYASNPEKHKPFDP